jgi:hypothetical protein
MFVSALADWFTANFQALCIGGFATAALIVIVASHGIRKNLDEGIASAIPAKAIITEIRSSRYMHRSDKWIFELTLKVTPPQGEPYEARTAWSVKREAHSKVQAGITLQVKIDSQYKTRIYSGESWLSDY